MNGFKESFEENPLKTAQGTAIVIVAFGGLAVGGYFGGRWLLRNIRENQANKDRSNPETHESWATRINMAFQDGFWGTSWGTNEEAFYEVVEEVPTQSDWDKVARKYKALYGRSLGEDMQGDLDSEEFNKAMDIIRDKPE